MAARDSTKSEAPLGQEATNSWRARRAVNAGSLRAAGGQEGGQGAAAGEGQQGRRALLSPPALRSVAHSIDTTQSAPLCPSKQLLHLSVGMRHRLGAHTAARSAAAPHCCCRCCCWRPRVAGALGAPGTPAVLSWRPAAVLGAQTCAESLRQAGRNGGRQMLGQLGRQVRKVCGSCGPEHSSDAHTGRLPGQTLNACMQATQCSSAPVRVVQASSKLLYEVIM